MLALRGGLVLQGTALEPRDLLIDGDRITAVGPNLSAGPGEERDVRGRIVMPGLVNAHTHAHNSLLRGLARNWTLENLLNHGPALNANRTPEDHYLSTAIGAVEMLRTGCTAAYDLFMAVPAATEEGMEAVVQAYGEVGMRATVAPAVADVIFYRVVPGLLDLLPADLRSAVESMQAAPTEGLLRMTENVIRRWEGSHSGRIHTAVSPTIPGQCTEEFLQGCRRLVQEHGVGLHTHLAESKVQAIYAQQRWGTTIAGHLAELGLVGPGFVGAHAIWLTPEDIRLLAGAGAAVAHNPGSNLRLGNGIAALREMLDAGLTVGIGTDGSACSDNQNVFEAMRFAGVVSTVRFPHQPERWVGAETILTLATQGGARVLGLAQDLGAIAPGRKADLALLRADSIYLRPLNDAANALVYAENGANVETVLVDGRVVLDGGRVLTVDVDSLYARAQQAAERLRARNAESWALAERLEPYVAQACRAAVATPFPVERYAAPSIG